MIINNKICSIETNAFRNSNKMVLVCDLNSLATIYAIDNDLNYVDEKIRVIGYNGGKEVVCDFREKTGKPCRLMLKLDNRDIIANGRDIALVSCYALDEMGRKVPNASPTVYFSTNTLGKIVGTGSDVCDHARVDLPYRRMREGVIAVAVKVGKDAGVLKIYAEADGLLGDTLEIELGEGK